MNEKAEWLFPEDIDRLELELQVLSILNTLWEEVTKEADEW